MTIPDRHAETVDAGLEVICWACLGASGDGYRTVRSARGPVSPGCRPQVDTFSFPCLSPVRNDQQVGPDETGPRNKCQQRCGCTVVLAVATCRVAPEMARDRVERGSVLDDFVPRAPVRTGAAAHRSKCDAGAPIKVRAEGGGPGCPAGSVGDGVALADLARRVPHPRSRSRGDLVPDGQLHQVVTTPGRSRSTVSSAIPDGGPPAGPRWCAPVPYPQRLITRSMVACMCVAAGKRKT